MSLGDGLGEGEEWELEPEPFAKPISRTAANSTTRERDAIARKGEDGREGRDCGARQRGRGVVGARGKREVVWGVARGQKRVREGSREVEECV